MSPMTTTCCSLTFWLYLVTIVGLVMFAGIMSGLTLGLMSLGLVDLEVLIKSGSPQDRKYAAKILPVVRNQHLLLCTLLIGNALAMEALPIFLDSLVSWWGAILISVTLILMFGEIFPQAICSRYGLAVGAAMIPVVRILVILFFPVSYPISKLLDFLLGKGHITLLHRAELKTLVSMHGYEAGKGGELTHEETKIIEGALELAQKMVKDAMTPISQTFSLDVNEKLDMKTMEQIMTKGHSRVPVFSGSPMNIIGLILVKNLLMTHPGEDKLVRQHATIWKIPRVDENMPLYELLSEFRKGHSHMAAVISSNNKAPEDGQKRIELKGHDHNKLGIFGQKKMLIQGRSGPLAVIVDIPDDSLSDSGNYVLAKRRSFNGLGNSLVRKEGDLAAEIVGQRSRKWEHTSIVDTLDIDSAQSFSANEEVIGIITMEDVIEELLQEEILDETDEYIDVHNKIKVNMLPPGERTLMSPSSPCPTDGTSPSRSFMHNIASPAMLHVPASVANSVHSSPLSPNKQKKAFEDYLSNSQRRLILSLRNSGELPQIHDKAIGKTDAVSPFSSPRTRSRATCHSTKKILQALHSSQRLREQIPSVWKQEIRTHV